MPRGDKSAYSDKQKRQADHIEQGYEDRGVPRDEAEARAWATVKASSGGGKKAGSGRRKSTGGASRNGGSARGTSRSTADRSAAAKKGWAARRKPSA